jgi:hypothetical protein
VSATPTLERAEAAPHEPDTQVSNEVATPRTRTVARRALFWIVLVLVLLTLVVTGLVLAGSGPSTERLSATNAHPVGAKALIEVLKQDGVAVAAPRSLRSAIADVSANPTTTTLVLYDQSSILTASQLTRLSSVASDLVVIEPSFTALRALAPSISAAGFAPSRASAGCDFGPAQLAGSLSGLGKWYRVDSNVDSTTCFGSKGAYSLVRVAGPDGTVTVLGSTTILTNQSITQSGNAALALGLFGANNHLVWYLPSFADAPAMPTGGIPAPTWVPLLAALLGLVVVAAAFWRGRRFGAIVIERMPVVVRASETLEGRARLYQKASARTHALDALRIGTLDRLAKLCGLPTRATLDDIVGAVASHTGRPLDEVRSLLVDETPTGDAHLVRLSDDLADLEKEVAKATRPS